MNIEIITTEQAVNSFKKLSSGLSLAPSFHSDLPVSDEVEQAMKQLAQDIIDDAIIAEMGLEDASILVRVQAY